MAPRPMPVSDLARMYQQRIPTAPKSIGRLGPVNIGDGGLSLNPMPALRSAGGFLKRVVESLDPRELAEQGGRSVQHVTGDIEELARSIVTGEDTLSESPSARAYQSAGGGVEGVARAVLPYVDVATAIVPTTKVLTPAGRVALAADAAERLAAKQMAIADRPPIVGIHVSPISGITEINPRVINQAQGAAEDSLVGSSYLWDARSPQTMNNIFKNWQMTEIAGLGNTPSIYVTRPRGRVFQDANVPMSSALRVEGPQQVVAQLPFNQQAVSQYLEAMGVSPRSATADRLEQAYRGLSPTVRQQVANRPHQRAEEALRIAIRVGQERPRSPWANIATLDREAPLDQLLTNSEALRVYNEAVVRYGGTPLEEPPTFNRLGGRR